jgi:hypothetical protein
MSLCIFITNTSPTAVSTPRWADARIIPLVSSVGWLSGRARNAKIRAAGALTTSLTRIRRTSADISARNR